MARNMTTVQNGGSIRFGSAKFEVGESESNLIDLGAMRGIVFEESWDETRVTSDNAGVIKVGMSNHLASIEGELMEINLQALSVIRGGIDTFSSISGTPQTVTSETVTLSGGSQKRLAHKNGNGSVVTSVVVTNTAGTVTYDAGDDYVIAVDSAGFTVISRVSGGVITDGQSVLVDYSYTPLSAQRLLTGGLGTFQPRIARITNYDDAGRRFQITVFNSSPESGLNITFPEADAEDPAMTPIRMTGSPDVNRAIGEQLFEIYDEQGVL